MRRTFDFLFYISLWLQQMWVLCPTLTFKGEQDVLEGSRVGKMHQTYGFQDQKIRGENLISFYICHYGCDKDGFCVEHRCSRKRTRQQYTYVSLVIVVTHKDVMQEYFDSGIPSLKILTCKMKIVNDKQQIGMKRWH